jgi:dolichol-phosphate mannosyltransferase
VGHSQWDIARKVKAGIDGILHSSYLPIRLISLVGVLISVCGFVAAAGIVVLRVWQGQRYPGWASIVCLLLMLNGLTILMLGVIGEYVWRIYNQAKRRPEYVIRRRLGL